METETKNLYKNLPDWSRELFNPSDYKVLYGGRGSGKSETFSRIATIQSLLSKKRILCGRELQRSLKDSVFYTITQSIQDMGLDKYFNIGKSYINSINGSEFLFYGLRHNIKEIKSTGGIDICWCEEAESISEDSILQLFPTIRKSGSEIWMSFNPNIPTDPVWRYFVAQQRPNTILKKINWRDNPWFPERLRREKDFMATADPDTYQWVWEGECRVSTEAQVLHGKIVVDCFEPDPDTWDGPYFGADWGFSRDPATITKVWIFDDVLYVDQENWGIGVEIDQLPAFFDEVPGARDYPIRADSSRPDTISYLNRNGFMVVPSEKGPGSVEDGITHLRGYNRIVINPRCRHAIEEGQMWRYKLDRLSGTPIRKLEPGYEHCWDAIRYSLEPVMRHHGALRITEQDLSDARRR